MRKRKRRKRGREGEHPRSLEKKSERERPSHLFDNFRFFARGWQMVRGEKEARKREEEVVPNTRVTCTLFPEMGSGVEF